MKSSRRRNPNKKGGVFYLNPLLLVTLQTVRGKRQWCCVTSAKEPPLVVRDWRLLAVLSSLQDRISFAQLRRRCASVITSSETLTDVLELFERHNIVRRQPFPETIHKKQWESYNWGEAFLYHFSTKDFPFVNASCWEQYVKEDATRMRLYRQNNPPPSPYTKVAARASFHKVPYTLTDRVSSVKLADRLQRQGDRRGQLLFSINFCFGEKSKRFFGAQGYTLKKTIPSGGARHPTEAFIISFCESLLPKGIYHYNVQHNSLDLYRGGDFLSEACGATYDLCEKFLQPPLAMLVLVSEVRRAMWRYRDDRSFRAVLVDAGIAMMSFRMLAQQFSLRVYSYQKFHDSRIAELLQLNKTRQIPLYVASIV